MVSVHPNPVKQQLNIALTGKIEGKAQVQILDIAGKVLLTLPVSGNNMALDMGSYAAGTYMIRYTDNSHHSMIKISKKLSKARIPWLK